MAALPLLLISFLSAAELPYVVYDGFDGPGKGKHIVLISGDEEYRSEEMIPQLGKILAKHHGFKCTVLFAVDLKDGTINPNEQKNIPGLEALKSADLAVLFLRFRDLPDEQMKHLVDYIESGKPIVALRTSTHAFDLKQSKTYRKYTWNGNEPGWQGGFGRKVLGETWHTHHGKHGSQSTRGLIAKDAAEHPILRGIKDGDIWGPTDVYGVRLPADVTPLVLGQVLEGMKPDDKPVAGKQNEPMMPIAWTRSYKPQRESSSVGDGAAKITRTFTSTCASSQDFESEGLRRLLVNACYWSIGLEDKIPAKSKVDLVGEYKASPFRSNGFVKGMKPSDHQLR